MSDIIVIEHLSKSYGDIKAVDDVSFRVEKGELFAFLGVNGAGKSTTISVLCEQIERDGGEVFIDGIPLGQDREKTKRNIGALLSTLRAI